MTPPYLRLRQVCLVSHWLAPVADTVQAVLGLPVCHRDPAVARFGLENALFALGSSFLEIVAPTQAGTAAGRFLARSGAPGQERGGYMLIFDCDAPEAFRQRAGLMGVRVVFSLDHPDYQGVQLHPRDCRAAILEFDHTVGGQALDGPYHPAGAHWQAGRRPDRVSGLALAEVESPDPAGLARHWSALLGWPARADADGSQRFDFDFGALRIVAAPAGTPERIAALQVAVADPAAVLAAAALHACLLDGGRFLLAGVWFEPVAGAISAR